MHVNGHLLRVRERTYGHHCLASYFALQASPYRLCAPIQRNHYAISIELTAHKLYTD